MIIFIDEDRAYLNWVTHHRCGFVMEGRYRPKLGHCVLHRATCANITGKAPPRSHWTTGGRLKACAEKLQELEQWSAHQTQAPALCDTCRPHEPTVGDISSSPLSKLARDVLDYVLEAALIHFEHEHPPYRLCVTDIAACFGKTPGQLSGSLCQLSDHGLITAEGKPLKPGVLSPRAVIYPTVNALRKEKSLYEESEESLVQELQKLHAATRS